MYANYKEGNGYHKVEMSDLAKCDEAVYHDGRQDGRRGPKQRREELPTHDQEDFF